ncbi:MAG TPA: hypothetical protein VJ438_06410 [Candidatus Nanoarchaeia archaeon]|nr:hypothetical protein [Candidatus Nanoarchaeia archaeon]
MKTLMKNSINIRKIKRFSPRWHDGGLFGAGIISQTVYPFHLDNIYKKILQ